jgi:hypothetical protein
VLRHRRGPATVRPATTTARPRIQLARIENGAPQRQNCYDIEISCSEVAGRTLGDNRVDNECPDAVDALGPPHWSAGVLPMRAQQGNFHYCEAEQTCFAELGIAGWGGERPVVTKRTRTTARPKLY